MKWGAVILVAVLGLSPVLLAADPVTEVWVSRYNRTTSRNDAADAIALDALGNLYVTGTSSGGVTNNDVTTVKYDAAGNQLWAASYNHGGNSVDFGLYVTADAAGNVYVAGQSREAADNYYDMILIKYDAAGNRSWVARYNGPDNKNDRPKGMALDASGNIHVTMESDSDVVTVKYDPGGNLLWTARYSSPSNGFDQPNAIFIDAAGRVYVTGSSAGDMITIKYGADGSQLWENTYIGPSGGAGIGNQLTVDAAGNVYVAGESAGTGTVYDFVTAKYDSAGTQLWAVRYDGPDHRLDEANFVGVDGAGNVYVVGNSYYLEPGPRSGPEIATIKYDASGNIAWVRRYRAPGAISSAVNGVVFDGAGNTHIAGFSFGGDNDQSILLKYDAAGDLLQQILYADGGSIMAVDLSGNVYVTGGAEGDTTRTDFTTIKYNAAGSRIWRSTYDTTSAVDDNGQHIAQDANGNTYVAGSSGLDGWNNDIVTVKYDPEGNELWMDSVAAGAGGVAGIAADDLGNVFVAMTNSPSDQSPSEIKLVKYNTAGNQLWTASYGGTDSNSKQAVALAVDNQGNAYVTGWVGVYLGSDIVTIKFDAAGNQLWIARTTGGYGEPSAIVVDASGNVYVTGHIAGGGVNAALSTFKYDVAGNPLWVSHYQGSGMSNALALDAAGNVYVTGWRSYDRTRDAMTTVKYDSGGTQIWAADYLGTTAISRNNGFSIAVDSSGNAYVAGRGSYLGPSSGMVIIKYDRSGNQIWVEGYSMGIGYNQASALALDSDANVYVTGFSDGGGTGSEYTTLKYNKDGDQMWAASYNGTGSGADAAAALKVDASGNIFVTGSSLGQGTGIDFVTIKYQQASALGPGGGGNGGSGGGGDCFINAIAW
jgi:hypothetical protein